MAVLYRSNAQSRVLEHALFNAAMPYRVYGGLRFFERQEIKHALAYLRLMASDDDDGALLRVINFPARGIGAAASSSCRTSRASAGISLWAAAWKAQVRKAEERARRQRVRFILTASFVRKGIPAFVGLIEKMRAATRGLPLPEIIEHVIEHSGLAALPKRKRRRRPAGKP